VARIGETKFSRRTGGWLLGGDAAYQSQLPILRSRVVEIRQYEAVIRLVLWYASGNWNVARNSESAMDAFEREVLRNILAQ
jgi:hypothetical protein